ncbi:MAG: DUF2809 domain-containing protein [Bacteroidota bacterium]
MTRFLTFNKRFFLLTILLFTVEVLIALFVHDALIRPYVGDILVVMLLYCFARTFLNTPVLPTALCVLFFSFLIEGLQYIKIVNILGLQHSTLAATVIGTSFAWMDIWCYIIGVGLILLFEKRFLIRKLS